MFQFKSLSLVNLKRWWTSMKSWTRLKNIFASERIIEFIPSLWFSTLLCCFCRRCWQHQTVLGELFRFLQLLCAVVYAPYLLFSTSYCHIAPCPNPFPLCLSVRLIVNKWGNWVWSRATWKHILQPSKCMPTFKCHHLHESYFISPYILSHSHIVWKQGID